jgi:bacterioferritin (cytochrome b1)
MVDFTKPINNADMVQGLNDLIHRNIDLAANYDQDFIKLLEDRKYIDSVEELKYLHDRHARLLGDTVRALGGAPDYRGDGHRLIGKSKSWLGKLRQDTGLLEVIQAEEDKLQIQYKESVQALKASPESVAVINQALEEREAPLQWLHQSVAGGRA